MEHYPAMPAAEVAAPPPEPRRPPWRRLGLSSTLHHEPEPEPTAEVRNRLRELRAEVQDLQALLTSVRAGVATPATFAGAIETTKGDVAALLEGLEQEVRAHDPEHSDTMRHLVNLWEQMTLCPLLQSPETPPADPAQQTHQLDLLEARCRAIIFEIGAWTIPARLNRWLETARTGYYVPFHAVFEDELPHQEDRVKVLNMLAWSPKATRDGLVDVTTGLIYRYDHRRWAQLAALLWIGVLLALCIAVVGAAALLRGGGHLIPAIPVPVLGGTLGPLTLPSVPDWPLPADREASYVLGWFAVLAGVVVHVGVAATKRMRDALPPVLSAEDLLPRVSAYWGRIALKLGLALFAFFALVLSVDADQASLLNFFLVGYALDSVVELFGASLEQRAAAQVSTLRQQLGVTGRT